MKSFKFDFTKKFLALILAAALLLGCLPALAFGAASLNVPAGTVSIVSADASYDSLSIGAGASLVPAEGKLLTLLVDGVETEIASGKTYSSPNPGGVKLALTDYVVAEGALSSLGGMGGDGAPLRDAYNPEKYRSAYYYEDGALVDSKSVLAPAANPKVEGRTPGYSAFIASGGEYSLKGADISLLTEADGHPDQTNDFVGLGAAVALYDKAKLVVEDSKISTAGVAKPAVYVDSSWILFKNSSYNVGGGVIYDGYKNSADMVRMISPPWVLGIAGNARGSNLVGDNSVMAYVDSALTAKGWGVVSSDSGSNGVITIINSSLTMTGNTGYGIYAIGGVNEKFYGTTFDAATYPLIMTGGTVLFTSYTGGSSVDVKLQDEKTVIFPGVKSEKVASGTIVPTTVKSQFGVMAHNSGSTTLEKGTVFETKNAAFLIKSGDNQIKVDNSKISVEDGVILQLIDNDDTTIGADMVGGGPEFKTDFYERSGWSVPSVADQGGAAAAGAPEGMPGDEAGGPPGGAQTPGGAEAVFTNVALKGDLFNASGYQYISGSATAAPSNSQGKSMTVTLGTGASLAGRISLSRPMHVWMDWAPDANDTQGGSYVYRTAKKGSEGEGDLVEADGKKYVQATHFTINEYYNLGHVINDAGAFTDATAKVYVKDGASWTVTGNSYLTSLYVEPGSAIKSGVDGKTLKLYVNGIQRRLLKGALYTGEIALKLE
ncbi:MAG: hypothetical protein LBT59_25185 [Clostridiales bacterium]|nr:hypothetical protein [Clostridiales bacterium]